MNILGTVDRCLHMIPIELIENKILYIELDKENYETIQSEITAVMADPQIALVEQKVSDIGKCLSLTYNGFKILIVLNKDKMGGESFYIAFKTKVI